ncbi:RNA polymerase sigma factor [Gemmatimonadota bacterium]
METADQLYADLIGPVEGRMKSVVAGIVSDPDDAADAFQNALIYIWKHLRRIHRHPNPHGYIIRVCISSAYDVLRKGARRREREVIVPEVTEVADDAIVTEEGYPVPDREVLPLIRGGIATLPGKQAQAVLLRLLEDQQFDVIGRVLGCSEVTARSHVSKGLAKLREHLAGLGLNPAEG